MSTTDPTISHSTFAEKLRGFDLIGILVIIIILAASLFSTILGAILVLAWVSLSQTTWPQIGYVAPKNWVTATVWSIILGITFKLVMKAVIMPLLGAPAVNHSYHFLTHNASALPGVLIAIVFSAGFGEETLYRGYLFERLFKLLGPGIRSTILIVLITSSLFAIAHYHDQGIPGVVQAAVVGLVFGFVYSRIKTIFPLMISHVFFDLTAVMMIYYGWEEKIAHWIF